MLAIWDIILKEGQREFSLCPFCYMKGDFIVTNKERVVLMPSYMKEFNCIGPACEDSCCLGWRVDLDKQTYLKYDKIQNNTITPIAKKMVKRKHNQKSVDSYGTIKMNPNGSCPFLDEQNLCIIHKDLGEEYLSDTCALYPRYLRKIDGKYERSATMSCPEIARLSLLNPKGINFEQVEESEDIRIKLHSVFDTEGHLFLNKPQRYFWDIRIFSISILQNRKYSLAERLILLGLFYKKIEVLQQNNQIKDIANLIEDMANSIEEKHLKDELKKVPTNTEIQMRLVKKMTEEKTKNGITNERYKECLRETLLGLGFLDDKNVISKEDEEIHLMLQKYEENYEKYLKPYLKEKEYILENYLVNEYFKSLMPFGVYNSIWDSYIFLCMLYSMIKLHLIGMAGYHKGLTDDITIKLIQSFSKIVIHNNQYIQGMIKSLKDNEFDSFAFMAILVKN